MGRTLMEVLPQLKIPDRLAQSLENTDVGRVVVSHDRQCVTIGLLCSEIIAKRDINILEAAIKDQFFRRKDIKVRISEKFVLDGVTVSQIMELYRESFMLELKYRNYSEYRFFCDAHINVADDGVVICASGIVADRYVCDGVKSYLEQTLKERFAMDVQVSLSFDREAAQSDAENKESEENIRQKNLAEDVKTSAAPQQKKEKATSAQKKKKRVRQLWTKTGFGGNFEGAPVQISQIVEEIGDVIVTGRIIACKSRTIKTGNIIFNFCITDYTDSIEAKVFCNPKEEETAAEILEPGNFVTIKGRAVADSYSNEITIMSIEGIKPAKKIGSERKDMAARKRVELHCHTNMSDMDGVNDVSDIISQAAKFGHPAIAITDHGVVQAFPEAMKCAAQNNIKVIYGCEGYLADVPAGASVDDVLGAKTYHIILLAQNDIGRINLYRMVSESHLKYFRRRPRIPRFLLEECREGIIVGSACEAGELFRALLNGAGDDELKEIVQFYDYLEIQPVANNAFMLKDDRLPPKTTEDLRNLNRRIAELGERFKKPVAATGDVHFLNPEDEVYRRIIMAGKGFEDADFQAPLYLRTTGDMLDELSYLGKKKAFECAVEVPNMIAKSCDSILPVRMDMCPPEIEGADDELRGICHVRAGQIYGEPLPAVVKERLDRELDAIIGNGYSVMYVAAKRLVEKSQSQGYAVGSRGSVGSSLAATMAGITEVNPLPPHYVCPKCHYSDFDSEQAKAHAGGAGFDMKDMDCPKCGTKMLKNGFDIPFETFMGFSGEKEPDIDLNFSGEYQARAHQHTEELFGKENTFRAGTIGTLQSQTAYGFVMKYFEEKGIRKRRCEVERIASGCVGIRRSTGQHPGGIVVMPKHEDIYSFTPIQHPANKADSGVVTTHFDYHSIEQNLLKLDVLAHYDPTMIRRLEELTGLDLKKVPFDDPNVMEIFKSTKSLGIAPDDIRGTRLGCLGIPEFGTDFAIQMLIDANPQCFADLVRIAGLAHGTDVWQGNAQDLILSGTATLETAICTRDDIMLYLISKGIEKGLSFSIMESVRKGRGLTPEWEESMNRAGVPQWYIDSCIKIKYMFPKAHAAAYVMMAWRIAWCKVYRPLEYYAAYFTVRGTGFDYATMGQGPDVLKRSLDTLYDNRDNLTDKEKLAMRDMRIAEEMYARGIGFMPIDIYKADAMSFTIHNGTIMPPFIGIDGMGQTAAESVAKEARVAKFLSKEDFAQRTRVSRTIMDGMEGFGLFGGMPESNQLSLFDGLVMQ